MRVIFTFLLALIICVNVLIASGPSTYFNIYLPPNNDAVQRNVALIVTALYDETSFTITDDGADGDTDDSFSGTLSAGQSYILYIKDNGINDDAQYASGGTLKRDGDYFIINSSKLWTNARDGGGYVPSSNGSSSGDIFYFAVPYQANGEQEIRIGSWDNANAVKLERYDNGTWVVMNNWTLDRLKPADWVGKKNNNATYPTVFRISCTPGKTVSVFECNWMETGSLGTSDMASMVSSETGTDAGKEFLVYLLPPGKQNTVVNPFTGNFFGGNFAHCYLYAGNKATTVTIKDAKTNGAVINRTYNIEPNRYADAFFSLDEWKSIYNGNGNPDTGPERPHVLIEANNNISVIHPNPTKCPLHALIVTKSSPQIYTFI